MEDYNKTIELDAKNSEAYAGRGNVKSKLNDFDGAIEDLNKAIELDTKNAEAYFYRGSTLLKLKDNEAGIKDSACKDFF